MTSAPLRMGNYDDHLEYGYAAYALVFAALGTTVALNHIPLVLGGFFAVAALPLTILGATFPDIDHHASKPHHALQRVVFVSGTIGAFYLQFTQSLIPIQEFLAAVSLGLGPSLKFNLFILCTSLVVGAGLKEAVVRFRPKHRGITHRLSTGLVVASILGGFVWYVATPLVWLPASLAGLVTGGAFYAGFLSHLQCDKMLFPSIWNAFRVARSPFVRVWKKYS